MCIAGCHPDDFRYYPISSGWHNVIWTLSHADELAPGSISSGWLLDTAVCHPDDISYHHMSSGWLSRNWYIIRMSYDNVIMSSGWHTLPLLSHPDEIANFDFPQHAVALQRFRNIPCWAAIVPIVIKHWRDSGKRRWYKPFMGREVASIVMLFVGNIWKGSLIIPCKQWDNYVICC